MIEGPAETPVVIAKEPTEPVVVPFWNDGSSGTEGLLYFPMTDRFANAQSENDWSEGTVSESSDYRGGDWKGIEEQLSTTAKELLFRKGLRLNGFAVLCKS